MGATAWAGEGNPPPFRLTEPPAAASDGKPRRSRGVRGGDVPFSHAYAPSSRRRHLRGRRNPPPPPAGEAPTAFLPLLRCRGREKRTAADQQAPPAPEQRVTSAFPAARHGQKRSSPPGSQPGMCRSPGREPRPACPRAAPASGRCCSRGPPRRAGATPDEGQFRQPGTGSAAPPAVGLAAGEAPPNPTAGFGGCNLHRPAQHPAARARAKDCTHGDRVAQGGGSLRALADWLSHSTLQREHEDRPAPRGVPRRLVLARRRRRQAATQARPARQPAAYCGKGFHCRCVRLCESAAPAARWPGCCDFVGGPAVEGAGRESLRRRLRQPAPWRGMRAAVPRQG